MPTYIYKARDDEGRLITGKMEISSLEALQARLESCGFFLVESTMQKKSIFEEDIFKNIIPVTDKNIYALTLQLGNTVSSGVPLLTSVQSIIDATKNAKLKSVIENVRDDISGGIPLSQAMRKHPSIFSQFYTGMLHLGESSGKLSKTLYALADYIKKDMEIKNRILAAISYPVTIFVLGLGIVSYLLIYVMPQFIEIFESQHVALPLPTQLLLVASHIVTNFWYLIVAFVVAIIAGYNMLMRISYFRLIVDQFKLKIPVIGQVVKKISIKSFIDGLYLLYSSGLPIISALNIVRSLVRNKHISNIVLALSMHMSSGKDLTAYLSLTDLFPADVLSMFKSAEESGTLENTLVKLSEIYNDEVNSGIAALIQAFEISVILLMGMGVGFVALSVLLPIFRMGQVYAR
ncbi:MAG: type II secretion system F family protein [Candidatus Omnitrophota bacterium]